MYRESHSYLDVSAITLEVSGNSFHFMLSPLQRILLLSSLTVQPTCMSEQVYQKAT
jgi:hypothetical protein